MIQFLLNQHVQTINEFAPSLSILDFLRLVLGRTGTKEGCASGDCGACTAVIVEYEDEQLHYKAVNTCITPVATLHGKQLITVEDLAEQNTLHPVQQSLVDCHGSQCGFCTPGIVMSLFAWWHAVKSNQLTATRETIEHSLSGNLCRCTGYKSIIQAAWQSLEGSPSDQFLIQQQDTINALRIISHDNSIDDIFDSHPSTFFSPKTLAELFQIQQRFPTASLVAGATDLGLSFTQALETPTALIYTGHIAEMKDIEETKKTITIGAAVSYTNMSSIIDKYYPSFGYMLNRLGSLQIRNQGTLGGNLANASPIGDTPPVIMALNGLIHCQSSTTKRSINANEFFTDYRQTALAKNECIVSIELPLLEENEVLKVYKNSKRFDDDISTVCVAIWIKFNTKNNKKMVSNIRIACGGVAAIPKRAIETEQLMVDKPIDIVTPTQLQHALSKDFSPIDDVRASAAYRNAVVAQLLVRAQFELGNQQAQPHSVNVFDPAAGVVHV